jgi:hypothetical protein
MMIEQQTNPYVASEFTLLAYERLLMLAKSKFSFKSYTEVQDCTDFIVWRHDIDLSLDQALKLARLEKKHGIQATYFVHLHNEFYNALDARSGMIIREIIALGHHIGLHFDVQHYTIQSCETLNHWLLFEKNVLETLFLTPIDVFSFHNTTEYSMTLEDDKYAGMINTYSRYFKQCVAYCSDSNGYWRYRALEDVLADEGIHQLQVLTHPGWWTELELKPREKIKHHAAMRYETTLGNYDETLASFGRLNL